MNQHKIRSVLILSLPFLFCALEAWARAGGGRNGGGILSLILAPFFMIYAWHVNKKINEKKAKVDGALSKMAEKDPVWDESDLESYARTAFMAIEQAWCDQDLEKLKKFLDLDLYQQWVVQLDTMRKKGWKNVMDELTLENVRIVGVVNKPGTEEDTFTACIDASAADYTVDGSGKVVDSNTSHNISRWTSRPSNQSFREFWTFRRNGDRWNLNRIDQSDAWERDVEAPIVDRD